MRHASRLQPSHVIGCLLTLTASMVRLTVPVAAGQAQSAVGAQSRDGGKQALAFLPNELWVHAGDSITWTFVTDEKHTVTFLKPGPPAQIRPTFQTGCPGTTPDGSSFDGSACVNSGPWTGWPTCSASASPRRNT